MVIWLTQLLKLGKYLHFPCKAPMLYETENKAMGNKPYLKCWTKF